MSRELEPSSLIPYRYKGPPTLPEVERKHVTLLWYTDFFDGPLSGVCLYKGKKHYFRLHLPCYNPRGKTEVFILFELTEEQVRAEHEKHAAFQEHVGFHTDYGLDGQINLWKMHPEGEWHKFYRVDWPELELKPEQAVAFFRV